MLILLIRLNLQSIFPIGNGNEICPFSGQAVPPSLLPLMYIFVKYVFQWGGGQEGPTLLVGNFRKAIPNGCFSCFLGVSLFQKESNLYENV